MNTQLVNHALTEQEVSLFFQASVGQWRSERRSTADRKRTSIFSIETIDPEHPEIVGGNWPLDVEQASSLPVDESPDS